MGAMMALPPGHGLYCFRIHGQIYHRTGTLHPPPNRPHQYGQIYTLDGPQATQTRLARPQNQHCHKSIMDSIHEELININPYAASYKHMHEVEEKETIKPWHQIASHPLSQWSLKKKDQRRYKLPTHGEVAAVVVGDDGIPPIVLNLIVYPRDRPSQNIWSILPIMALCPIPSRFHMENVDGVQHSTRHATAKRNTITHLQFYSFHWP